jgi:hypothetical protein
MEPAAQAKSRNLVWIRVLAVLISAPAALVLLWRDVHDVSNAVPLMATFAVAAAVCVVLPLGYLFLPHQRGPRAPHLLGAAIGGLIAISLVIRVFEPLIRIQMSLTATMIRAIHLDRIAEWNAIMSPYGACIEIVLIGMVTGWLVAAILARLHAKRSRMQAW